MIKVALLIVATNKYTQFLPALLESVNRYFLCKSDVTVCIFTDRWLEIPSPPAIPLSTRGLKIKAFTVDHKPWPYATLYRFHFFQKAEPELREYDYLFYIDADTIIKDHIVEGQILFPSVAVQHCGFVNRRGTYEERIGSVCAVSKNEGSVYFGGGFWGFNKDNFWTFIRQAVDMVNRDQRNGITPIHNDESVLNRYLIWVPPTVILPPSFHYPEGNIEYYKKMWPHDYECKILLLDKNHEEIRS